MQTRSEFKQAARDYYQVEWLIEQLSKRPRLQRDPAKLGVGAQLRKAKNKALLRRWGGISWEDFCTILSGNYFAALLKQEPGTVKQGIPTHTAPHPQVKFQTVPAHSSLSIAYGIHPTPFGSCFLALSREYICKLAFVGCNPQAALKTENGAGLGPLAELSRAWPRSEIFNSQKQTFPMVSRIFGHQNEQEKFSLLVSASPFQLKVWRALLGLRKGMVAAYSQLAALIQQPEAVRPVAGAVAKNPISYLVPCHRVITKSGQAHAYRWGRERKLAMLMWEAA